jgi:hypothetical protein
MLPEDEGEFLKFVRATGGVDVLPWKSPTREFKPFHKLPTPFTGDLWTSAYLLNKAIPHRLIVTYVPTQKYYTVEDSDSSVIEFSRSYLKDGKLKEGRLWADFARVGGPPEFLERLQQGKLGDKSLPPLPSPILEPKEPEFKAWYETLIRWIRKHCKPLPGPVGEHVGPAAAKAVKEGRITLGSSA